jgi:hypothetical protein
MDEILPLSSYEDDSERPAPSAAASSFFSFFDTLTKQVCFFSHFNSSNLIMLDVSG